MKNELIEYKLLVRDNKSEVEKFDEVSHWKCDAFYFIALSDIETETPFVKNLQFTSLQKEQDMLNSLCMAVFSLLKILKKSNSGWFKRLLKLIRSDDVNKIVDDFKEP